MNLDFLNQGDISDEEFVRQCAMVWDEWLRSRESKDFEPDPIQMKKFEELVRFFANEVDEQDGYLDKIDISPSGESAGITAYFLLFDVSRKKIPDFCRVLSYCSDISLDTTTEGDVCISCAVTGVFRRKTN